MSITAIKQARMAPAMLVVMVLVGLPGGYAAAPMNKEMIMQRAHALKEASYVISQARDDGECF
jgi:hypothetical protein